MEITDIQKLGVGLASFGVFFLLLGVTLLFDKGLLAIGNLFCIAGLVCVIGIERSTLFFAQAERLKGTCCFFGGIAVVLLGWPVLGMVVELYGFVTLFGGFFPMAINFLRCVPVVSSLLSLPGISTVCDGIVQQGQAAR